MYKELLSELTNDKNHVEERNIKLFQTPLFQNDWPKLRLAHMARTTGLAYKVTTLRCRWQDLIGVFGIREAIL